MPPLPSRLRHCLYPMLSLPLWLRQRSCLVFPLPSRRLKTLPVPCVSTAFAAAEDTAFLRCGPPGHRCELAQRAGPGADGAAGVQCQLERHAASVKTLPFAVKTLPFAAKTLPFAAKTLPFAVKTLPFAVKTLPFAFVFTAKTLSGTQQVWHAQSCHVAMAAWHWMDCFCWCWWCWYCWCWCCCGCCCCCCCFCYCCCCCRRRCCPINPWSSTKLCVCDVWQAVNVLVYGSATHVLPRRMAVAETLAQQEQPVATWTVLPRGGPESPRTVLKCTSSTQNGSNHLGSLPGSCV